MLDSLLDGIDQGANFISSAEAPAKMEYCYEEMELQRTQKESVKKSITRKHKKISLFKRGCLVLPGEGFLDGFHLHSLFPQEPLLFSDKSGLHYMIQLHLLLLKLEFQVIGSLSFSLSKKMPIFITYPILLLLRLTGSFRLTTLSAQRDTLLVSK